MLDVPRELLPEVRSSSEIYGETAPGLFDARVRIGGIAGDMFLALAIDLGIDLSELERTLRALPLAGWRFEVTRQRRHEIEGTHLEVVIDGASERSHRPWSAIRSMLEQVPLPARPKAG